MIHSGVSGQLSSLVGTRDRRSTPAPPATEDPPGFLLYVGGDDARKNMEGTIRAYARLPAPLRSEHQLVIACRIGPLRRFELGTFAASLGIGGDEIELTGFVTDQELAALYRACELFIFPSLYEGAGLPILEAMSCDAPVAASNTSSIPELLGDLEATFDPADPADIAAPSPRSSRTPCRRLARERSRRARRPLHLGAGRERDARRYERALASLAGSHHLGHIVDRAR